MAHVAQMDVWNRQDACWRHFFHGKPYRRSRSIRNPSSTISWRRRGTTRRAGISKAARCSSRRGCRAGSAGLRAAMTKWCGARRSATTTNSIHRSGLESEGIAVDFQVGVNDYLYGTRFMSYLALKYGPEKFVEWQSRREGSKAFYAAQFKHVFGRRLDDVWNDWIAFEHDYQKANLAKLAQYPLTETVKLSPHGPRLDLARLRRRQDQQPDRRLPLSRHDRLRRPDGPCHRQADQAPGNQGHDALQGDQPRLRSRLPGPPITPKTITPSATSSRSTSTPAARSACCSRTRASAISSFNPADKSIWGIRHENGLATIVRIPPPYAGFNQVHTFKYGQVPFDLDISPDGTLLSASFGEINGTQTVRVWKIAALRPTAIRSRSRGLRCRRRRPRASSSRPTARRCTARPTIPASRTSSASTSPPRNMTRSATPRPASSGQCPQPDGSLIAYEYSGKGLQPVRFKPQVQNDLGTVEFLGTRVVNERPELKQWGVGSPSKIDLEPLITARSKYNSGAADEARRRSIRSSRDIRERSRRATSSISKTRCSSARSTRASASRRSTSCAPGTGCTRNLQYKTLNWDFQYRHNGADFYDLFGPVERSRRGDVFSAATTRRIIYDPPRQLDLFGSGGRLSRARHAAGRAEHRQPEEHPLARSGREIHQHAQGAGRRRP